MQFKVQTTNLYNNKYSTRENKKLLMLQDKNYKIFNLLTQP